MDKLTMAHDYALKLMGRSSITIDEAVRLSFDLAEAMQAEAEKREDKTRPEVLRNENSPQLDIHGLLHSLDEYFDQAECTKTDRMANNLLAEIYEKLSGEVNSVREWQPDWSQAPEWANWWAMDGNGDSYWHSFVDEPFVNESIFEIANPQGHTFDAPSFDYQGNWQNSLRKRPK